ncbi:hypothetical protein BD289DRAFT_427085 [Coniella lustricola]|uniref:Uncharacterized protein n=1 Tax=Coniella lustricola TaxID=2025994 RepID=A0A2T3AFN2_9PEZI|nr:hypothetical protein BD289DRAFT_427085 [Coniella lustricola]
MRLTTPYRPRDHLARWMQITWSDRAPGQTPSTQAHLQAQHSHSRLVNRPRLLMCTHIAEDTRISICLEAGATWSRLFSTTRNIEWPST